MKRAVAFCVFLVLLLAAALAIAVDFEEAPLPDTPAATQLKALLTALESGDHENYIRNNFNDEFLNAFPMENHLQFFKEVRAMHGGFLVHTIERSSDFELAVLVKSKKRDAWRRMGIAIESTPPHKVASFGIDMAGDPDKEVEALELRSEREVLAYAQNKLDEMTDRGEFSGAVLIAKDGVPLLRRAYGEASKEFGVPNRTDTKFNIGSINKSFTKMAIAQLLEEGKIGLHDKIGKYLSDLPGDWGEKITVWHLLTMRSGLGHYWNAKWQSKFAEIKTVDQLMEVVLDGELHFEPGRRKQYSNSGYVVLGAIIEKVSGQSYYDYIREHVYEPAGMKNSDSYELDQIVPNLARGYTANRSGDPFLGNDLQNNLFLHSVKGSPAGGGYSTLDDLNNYVEALKANKLAGEKYTNMALGMFENADDPERRPKGLGIAGGGNIGINAIVEADFDSGFTVVVLSNYDPPVAEELGIKLMRMLLEAEAN
jgi:CubicO group peptidase (beta-lactamase class C family)